MAIKGERLFTDKADLVDAMQCARMSLPCVMIGSQRQSSH